ncbi:MAG: hypothetical protein IPH72_26620 [Sandaracinaceae bacterium]|nr:hypothetical protein [Sandaracinaceae bacterium]
MARASDGALLAGHIHDDTQTGTTREWSVATMADDGALASSWTRASNAGELTSQGAIVPGLTSGFMAAGWTAPTTSVWVVTTAGEPPGTAVTHGRSELLGLNPAVLVFARNDGFDALWAQPIDQTAPPMACSAAR